MGGVPEGSGAGTSNDATHQAKDSSLARLRREGRAHWQYYLVARLGFARGGDEAKRTNEQTSRLSKRAKRAKTRKAYPAHSMWYILPQPSNRTPQSTMRYGDEPHAAKMGIAQTGHPKFVLSSQEMQRTRRSAMPDLAMAYETPRLGQLPACYISEITRQVSNRGAVAAGDDEDGLYYSR
ncbi:hypothetical protein F66182_10891 [Fusarium sp. NRRL 66182]|nr:hypothetical protein F66182_10891 [Fusarium sp. NRRL 66182]